MVTRLGLYGFAASDYSEPVRGLIRSYKELGESSLAQPLASRMATLVRCFHEQDITLTAIPGNRRASLERGFNPAELLARDIHRIHPEYGFRRLLRKSRDTLDQSKLKPGERLRNLENSMVAEVGNLNVVVIDDIVTTGATMKAAADALQHAGHKYVGFVTFAETESKKV
jgi:ComF family protein